MKLKNWIKDNQLVWNTTKNKYSVYCEYIENRYANFDLLYEGETFNILFTAFLLENSKELMKIENIKDIQINSDNLGDVINQTDDNNANFEGENSINYVGLNVEGTFNKNNTTSTTKTKNNKKTNRINIANELIKLNNLDLIRQFQNLNEEFEKLLVTIQPVSWFF